MHKGKDHILTVKTGRGEPRCVASFADTVKKEDRDLYIMAYKCKAIIDAVAAGAQMPVFAFESPEPDAAPVVVPVVPAEPVKPKP